MPMTKAEFKEAFRTAISSEFESIPKCDAEIPYEFSPAFMKKMKKLLRAQKKASWKFVNTGFKRLAIAALVAAMLFASACSFKTVRDSMIEFFTAVYETFAQIFLEGDTSVEIPKPYELEAPPQGFTETNRVETDTMSVVEYTDESGNKIEIRQLTTYEGTVYVDIEDANTYAEKIDGIDVQFCVFGKNYIATYVKGQYYITIKGTGEVELSIIKQIITDLK